MPTPTTYLYRERDPVIEDIGNTGITFTSVTSNLTKEISAVTPDVLDGGDKSTLDDYMDTHQYDFVSQTP